MNNIHNNWRKFLAEGSYNETKLLYEVTEEEIEYIQTAVDEMGPEDLAFNELFKGAERVVIPFAAMDLKTELGMYLAIMTTADSNNIELDKTLTFVPNWEKGFMEKEKTISASELSDYILSNREPKKQIQSIKIGKWLASVERAIKRFIEWRKYTSDNDIGSAYRPATEEEQKKEQQIGDAVYKFLGTRGAYSIINRFRIPPAGNIEERLEKVIERIQWMKGYWQQNADYIKKNPQGEIDDNTYSIVITRNPIDVLRMSDFRNIQSCHSPASRGGSGGYFKCAVAEAHGEGAVAYVVKTRDINRVFKTEGIDDIAELDDQEFFVDDARNTGFINPIARVRIRLIRYYDTDRPQRYDEGTDLGVVEERVYGQRIPGFQSAVENWLKENQVEQLKNLPLQPKRAAFPKMKVVDLDKFIAFGGSYEDNSRAKLLKKLITDMGLDHSGGYIEVNTETEDNLEGVGSEAAATQMENEAGDLLVDYRFTNFGVTVGSDFDEEYAWITSTVLLNIFWDTDEWNSLPNNDLLRYIPDEVEGLYGDKYNFLKDYGASIRSDNVKNDIIVTFGVDVGKARDDEDVSTFIEISEFESFLDTLSVLEDTAVPSIKSIIEMFMRNEGHMQGGALIKLGRWIESVNDPKYEWDWHVEEGYNYGSPYELISAETRMFLKYGDIPEQVVKKVFSTREFWLDIRKRMHAPIHEHFENKYFVDIEKFIIDFDGEEVEFKLNYAVGEEDPDDTVKIFERMIEHWDDEELLYGLFNTVLEEYAAKVDKLTPMEDSGMDMNRDDNFTESKKVSGQKLFNNWRSFLES